MHGPYPSIPQLRDDIATRIEALIAEMQAADWPLDAIVEAIGATLRDRWQPRLAALREARAATPSDFISDGNEG